MTAGMRARRCLLLVFLAYILLDLGSPFVPGAFTFDPADSVDAVSAARARLAALPRIAPAWFTAMPMPPLPTPVVHTFDGPAPAHPTWRPPTIATADPRPSLDDD